MRLIVDQPDFPFFRETRLARAVDVTVLVLLAALVVHTVRQAPSASPALAIAEADGPVSHQVVLTMHPDGRWTLNGRLVPPADYETELRRVFDDRAVKLLFVAADAGTPYGDVRTAEERARGAGITTVVFLPAPRNRSGR